MRSAALLAALASILLLPGRAAAGACAPEQVAAIEQALRDAPLSYEVKPPEKVCGRQQAMAIRRVLAACQPAPAQAVLYLGAGRCLQQAGYNGEAIAAYRHYIEGGDPAVTPERAEERRDRVRRWLKELGEPEPPTAALLLRSDLQGPTVRYLEGYPNGVVVGQGTTRIPQPPGARRLSLNLKGFERVELPVELYDGEAAHAEVEWQKHLSPRYGFLRGRWDDFRKSGLTPAGYVDRRQRPLTVALSLLVAGAGAALIGVCAANTGDACDATWKQGLAYGFGVVLGLSGILGAVAGFASPLERLPSPELPVTSP